jgi:hypothetical protein
VPEALLSTSRRFQAPIAGICYDESTLSSNNKPEGKKPGHKTNNKNSGLHLTFAELEVLLPLASDQLFRNEFIDKRIPGFQKTREEVQAAKALVSQIKERMLEARQKSGDTLRISIQYP